MSDGADRTVSCLARSSTRGVVLVALLSLSCAGAARAQGPHPDPVPASPPNVPAPPNFEPRPALAPADSPADGFLKEGLERVDWLEKAGAMGLAASVLVKERPPIEDAAAWMQWERRLWRNLAKRRLWDRVIERHASLEEIVEREPLLFPAEFVLESRVAVVDAQIQLGAFADARANIRKLLLARSIDSRLRSELRRKIFLTYLESDDVADADLAMDRYEREYFPDDTAWNVMRARVLIRSGHPAQAVNQLASAASAEASLVKLHGRLLDGSLTSNAVADAALALDEKRLRAEQRVERWSLIAEAAKRSGTWLLRVEALERALATAPRTGGRAGRRPLFEATVSDLLEAYHVVAERIGNDAHLLIGDVRSWLDHADALHEDSPPGARSIHVYLGRLLGARAVGTGVWARLADSLRGDGLKPLIFRLFGESAPLGDYDQLRGPVGLALSEEALEAGDVRVAAALSAGITQPPPGVSHLEWRLRQARMSIYAGNYEHGIGVLDDLLSALPHVTEQETDRILQVIFDLQALGRHRAAAELLEAVLELSPARRQQREILFWMAESLEAGGRPERAALLFLRSSTMRDADGIWAHTARYRAAGALHKAGLVEDARGLYESLLATTRDPGRRQLLARKLRDLRLHEFRGGSDADAAPGPEPRAH